ncbi:MAG: KUP/HAK/KT family potassium transporter [Caldilineaceae bacterium]
MYSDPNGTPPALLHNIKHNKVLHEQVILLSVEMEEIRALRQDRVTVHHLENDFHRVILRYGFPEDPNVPRDLVRVRRHWALPQTFGSQLFSRASDC